LVRTSQQPFSRDEEAESAANSCTRFLASHGPRRAQTLLGTIPNDTPVDYYGVGGVVRELEDEIASLLGKEAALFVPSGTMAQQMVLRIHADRRGKKAIAYHPACHLDSHEERGYQHLHGLFGVPVGSRYEPLSASSLAQVHEPLAALLIELPQRDLGGTLPAWGDLCDQVSWAHEHGAAAHLDGARLWESLPYYKKSAADVAGLFDSVYVSFYKGLGGLGGACVAGDTDVIAELATWRTRHGGRLFGMWPYAASALTVLRARLPRMPQYFRHATAISKALHDLPGVEVIPDEPQAPMMHLRLSIGLSELRRNALEVAAADKVWTFARPYLSEGPTLQRIEFPIGDATLELSPVEIRSYIERLASGATTAPPPMKAVPTSPKRATGTRSPRSS
jgi:threonine aldolase